MRSSRRSHPHKSAQEVARSSSECAKSCPRHRCSIILEEGRPRGVGGGWLHIKIVCRMCTLPRGTGYRVFHSCQQASAKKCGFVVAGGARSAFQQGSTLYSVFQRILLYSAASSTCSADIRLPLYARRCAVRAAVVSVPPYCKTASVHTCLHVPYELVDAHTAVVVLFVDLAISS